jgi:hypothetical protein
MLVKNNHSFPNKAPRHYKFKSVISYKVSEVDVWFESSWEAQGPSQLFLDPIHMEHAWKIAHNFKKIICVMITES